MTFAQVMAGIFEGFQVTASVTLLGMLYAVPFAFVAGVAQYSAKGWAHAAITAVIESGGRRR